MTLLKINGLTKTFGGLRAILNFDLEVKKGQIIGLIGPNGAGKTTIFNLITGFLHSDSGVVYFKDKKINNLKPYQICKLGISRTFQLVKPFLEMSVLGNVIVGSIYGKNEKKISLMNAEKNAIEILDLVKLMSKKNVLASNLTYGDKKRLELAKALATNPELLLLDEVMGGLNPVELSEFMKIIKDINYNGITLVLIEHVMQAIMELGEEIYVLDHGKKIAFGTPAEVSKDRLVIESYIGKVD